MTPVIAALDILKLSGHPGHPSPSLSNGVDFRKVEVVLKE